LTLRSASNAPRLVSKCMPTFSMERNLFMVNFWNRRWTPINADKGG
jgi:hypothetical protein